MGLQLTKIDQAGKIVIPLQFDNKVYQLFGCLLNIAVSRYEFNQKSWNLTINNTALAIPLNLFTSTNTYPTT